MHGYNSSVDRRGLWRDLRFLPSCIDDSPWVQMGEYNIVRRESERLGGFDVQSAAEFNSCLVDIGMDDLCFKGFTYTRSNKRG